MLEPDTGKELTVSVDLSKFSKPGVYRYKITDATAKGTLDAAGLTRDEDYNPERYLDVYIHYSDDDTPVLEVYGYVLAEANNTETTVDTESKTVGYTEDEYHTIDVTLEKVVTGSMGDTQHEFPFSIVITNNDLSYYGKENETPTVDDDSSATSITVGLKSGDKYYLTGLSPKATVTYTETNDTADTYELTITGTETTITPGDIAPLTGTQTTGALAVSTYEDSGTQVDDLEAQNEEVVFTNNLDEVSPTGLVLRVAPYALILAAGIALLMISRRRKTVTE